MTPEAQRIAIAEACSGVIRFVNGEWQYNDGGYWMTCKYNALTRDLHAMHEAEKCGAKRFTSKLEIDDYWSDLNQWLEHITACNAPFATAAQRAEALLRTLNLWRDDL